MLNISFEKLFKEKMSKIVLIDLTQDDMPENLEQNQACLLSRSAFSEFVGQQSTSSSTENINSLALLRNCVKKFHTAPNAKILEPFVKDLLVLNILYFMYWSPF